MVAFIDAHRAAYGVEPICEQLPIAPSTYRTWKAQQRAPETRAARVQRDELLRPEIQRVWDDNFQVYGAEKVWRQLGRGAVNVRWTRSAGRGVASSRTVVIVNARPRVTPRKPMARMSRSTVQRAAPIASRPSCRHTFSAP